MLSCILYSANASFVNINRKSHEKKIDDIFKHLIYLIFSQAAQFVERLKQSTDGWKICAEGFTSGVYHQ